MIKRVLPGALKEQSLYNQSKYHYLLEVMVPAIQKAGVKGKGGNLIYGDNITDEMMVNELNYIYSKRTGASAFSQMYLQRHKIDKNIAVSKGAMNIDKLSDLAKSVPEGPIKEFEAAWKDFKTVFGETFLPQVTSMIKESAVFMRDVKDMMDGNFSWKNKLKEMWKENTGYKPQPHDYDPIAYKSNPDKMINNTIVMPDGKVLANVVTKEQAKEASRPTQGTTSHDGRMSPVPVGASGGW